MNVDFKKDYQKAQKKMKNFVRYKEGAELYSMCQTKFERLAKDDGAVYKVDRLVLVNLEVFEKYLETFRLVEGGN